MLGLSTLERKCDRGVSACDCEWECEVRMFVRVQVCLVCCKSECEVAVREGVRDCE